MGRPTRLASYALALMLGGALAVSLGARPAEDEWYEYYHRAQRAIDRSDWDTAITELELAVTERSGYSRNARTYGVRFVRYFPYYYLGVAHFGAGDDEEARRYLDLEEQEGEIQRNDEFADRLRVLLRALTGPGGTLQGGRLSPAEVEEALGEVARLRTTDPLAALMVVERLVALDPSNQARVPDLAELRMDGLREELKAQCPDGKVNGVFSKYEGFLYFLVHQRKVTATGYCVRDSDGARAEATATPPRDPAAPEATP